MPVFTYTARNDIGRRVEGLISADNERAALDMLDRRKLMPLSVAPHDASRAGLLGLIGLGGRRISTDTRCRFYRQLADLLKAGLPILRALGTLEKQGSDARFKPVLEEMRLAVSGGSDLGDAMASFPDLFGELEIGMIRAGEKGGFLEDVLSRLAAFTERAREVAGQVTGALIYPAMLALAGIGVIVVLMVFVLPSFAKMLEGLGALPAPTKIVMGISNFLQANFLPLLAGVAVLTFGVLSWARSEDGRTTIDRWKLRFPVVGRVMKQVAVARFARTLGTLLSSGIPIGAALKIASDAAGNRVIGAEIRAAAERVGQGETLSAPLTGSPNFPPMLTEMIAVGEETGTLDKVLVDAAAGYERDADRAVTMMVRLVEPLVLIVMTMVVLMIALSVILPALSAAGNIGKR